jgi:hypothetical protein
MIESVLLATNLNTNKPIDIRIRPNINEYKLIGEKLRSNYLLILVSIHNFSVSIIFYRIYF